MRHYNIPIFVAHYGCPHMCVFCNQKKISGCTQEINEIFIKETIENYLETIPQGSEIEVAFFGGSFTAISVEIQQKFLESVKPYIDTNRINGIRISTRPDYINKEIVDFLIRYGVKTVELGAQSFNDNVLKQSERGHTGEDIRDASKIIKESGIKLGIQIMPGLPGSNFESDVNDALEICKIKPDIVRIYPTLVIKETKLAELYSTGEFVPMSITESVERVAKIYGIIEKENIRIIRVGLQPSDDIREDGVIIAGPFHPAFRELVESELFFRFFEKKMKENDRITVYINVYDISRAKGINKSNINKFEGRLEVILDKNLKKDELIINNEKFLRRDILAGI